MCSRAIIPWASGASNSLRKKLSPSVTGSFKRATIDRDIDEQVNIYFPRVSALPAFGPKIANTAEKSKLIPNCSPSWVNIWV